uniref:Amine oxidase domain-containing protein n=1 Tax=viral metagenome TaxID=1070528 RepID=A0A6C0KUJ5_9ZZZZ
MDYDFIIIGGGPSGLTLALYLAEIGKNCMLIDKNSSLGGCHRVTRTETGEFTEHGPRVYSSAYKNVDSMLKKINTNWNETFTPYKFNIGDIGGTTFNNLSLREKFLIGIQFIPLFFGIEKRNLSIGEFINNNNFSSSSKDYIDRICRLTDGAGSDRYTLYQFLQLYNENVFEALYQPKHPNDHHLFHLWEKKLIELGVTIFKNTNVLSINDHTVHTDTAGSFTGKKVLICIPPKPFVSLLKKSSLSHIWSGVDVEKWSETNSYIIDIPITFHWKQKVDMPKVWGFPRDDWAIAFIILSDYMKVEDNYNFVISTCITRIYAKSSKTGKTAVESTQEEMIEEVFRQLRISFPQLPKYDKAIVHKTTLFEEDTAFVETANGSFIPMNEKDIYYIGTQNGNSFYSFTSMESAVTNSLYALKKLDERFSSLNIRKSFTLIQILRFILLIIFLLIIILLLKNGTTT